MKIKRLYGDYLFLWGTVGTQTTLPFGSPDDVKSEVKRMIQTVGRGGGLLIAPSHVIEPDVPWDSVIALVGAVRESCA